MDTSTPAEPQRRASLQRVVRNFSALSLAEVVRVALSGLATIYLARVLGAEGFGIYGFAVALLGYFTTVVDGGLAVLGTRDVARAHASLQQRARDILGLRLALAVLMLLALVVVTLLLDKPVLDKVVLLLSGSLLFTYALSLDWVFYGLEKAHIAAIASVIQVVVFAGAAVLLVHATEQVWLVPVLQAAGELLAAIFIAAVYVRLVGLPIPTIHWRVWRELVMTVWPIGLSHLMRAVIYSFGVIVVGLVMNESAVGLFVGAQKLVLFLTGFGSLYFFAYLPSIARSYTEGRESMQHLLVRSIHLTALLSLPMALGATIIAPQVFALVYPESFAGAVPSFQVMIWMVPCLMLAGHFRQALIAVNLQRLDLIWVAASAGLNVVLSLVLVPLYGLVGASLAIVISEFALAMLGYFTIAQRVAPLAIAGPLLRPVLAAGLMAGVVWALRTGPAPLSISAGALVYFALLFALGEIRPRQFVSVFRS